ncbi:MAG TPA: PilZ domain-containing protein [Pyrinomonadaceae bacterium]|nr:PilZ domain-containing protein [Pyrinomonadaceae bacterium]
MSELLRTWVSRIREYAGDRRHMPRYRTRLEVTVAPATPTKANGRRPASIQGYTRDISSNGLGLIVPAIRIGDRYLAGENCRLAITLELPSGPIQLIATSERYEPLDDPVELGFLIGTNITTISDADRKAFLAYLKEQR